MTSRVVGIDELFVHPVQDEGVMAGNSTIGVQILDDLQDPDAGVLPYAGGGLTVRIASAIRARRGRRRTSTPRNPRPAPRCPRRWRRASRALAGRARTVKVVCVVSGGNFDMA